VRICPQPTPNCGRRLNLPACSQSLQPDHRNATPWYRVGHVGELEHRYPPAPSFIQQRYCAAEDNSIPVRMELSLLNIGIDEEEEKRQLLMTAIPDCVDPELADAECQLELHEPRRLDSETALR